MISITKYEPKKINSLPEDIQKLVWRAIFYLSQIENYLRKCSWRRDEIPVKKLDGYSQALENLQKIIEKKCSGKKMEKIVIEYNHFVE